MARRRLHGVTQKRRRKAQTRTLKRQATVQRVKATQQPAPFQREARLEPQDITFLEAMREMGVRRIPHTGEAPARLEAFQQVIQAAGAEEADAFQEAMEDLGVRRLGPGKPSRPPGPPMGRRRVEKPPTQKPPETAPAGEPKPLPPGTAGEATGPEPQAPPGNPRRGKSPPHTEFQFDGGDGQALEQWLAESDFDPASKFEGAPRPAARGARPAPPSDAEPDAELDLHGQTQEQAIRMVQNFLLTAAGQRLREVVIITGRGANSGERGPVLRETVYGWLQRNGDRFAREFGPAPARHGGEGAIRVVLR